MTDPTRDTESLRDLNTWLQRQTPEVQQALRASINFETDTVRDAVPGEPVSGAIDCLRRLAELDRALPGVRYFKIAHDLMDKAGVLAFQIGVTHYKTEHELLAFLSLAGTVFFGDRGAIQRFEKGFRADSAVDDVVLYLQAELDMLDGGFPAE